MKTYKISPQPLQDGDDELIQAAREAVLPLVDQRFEGERITSVGAAARWKDGRVFTGLRERSRDPSEMEADVLRLGCPDRPCLKVQTAGPNLTT